MESDKIPLLGWDKIFRPKKYDEAGLRDWNQINVALGAKLVWQMVSDLEHLWTKILRVIYLDSNDRTTILTVQNPLRGSAIRNFIISCRHVITDHISWKFGDGGQGNFWEDSWNGYKVLDEEC